MSSEEEKIEEFYQRLTERIAPLELGVAARLVYYSSVIGSDRRIFLLGIHTTHPEKVEQATQIAFEAIRTDIYPDLIAEGFGFAGQQI